MCEQDADKGQQHSILRSLWSDPGSCYLYIEDWPLPTVCDFGHIGVLCTFSYLPAAAAAGIARISQLSSFLLGQAVRYVMSSGNTRLSQYKLSPLHPSPPDKLGRTPCWVSFLRPSAFVSYPWSQQQQILQKSLSDRNPGGLCSFTLYGKKSKKPIFDKENKCIHQSMSMGIFIHICVGRA
jgi:hypothetical protein